VIGALGATRGGRGGPALLFSGMFTSPDRPDWPAGVQEEDAPRFALEHASALRSGTGDTFGDRPSIDADEPQVGEIIELFDRPLA
jgi:hypothetical protein